jgi:hypothetical protein
MSFPTMVALFFLAVEFHHFHGDSGLTNMTDEQSGIGVTSQTDPVKYAFGASLIGSKISRRLRSSRAAS